jgi:hypothetical protein
MVSLKKVAIMRIQRDTSAEASTMLVSADGVLVRQLSSSASLFRM